MTPRVDFYILADDNRRSVQHFACRLVEKAYLEGHNVFIKTDSADESRMLDNLLWTMQEDSFIPHAMLDEASNDDQPVLISHDNASLDNIQLLINLSSMAVQQHNIERIAEILNQQVDSKQTGREHYKTYRASGFELHHHEIKTS